MTFCFCAGISAAPDVATLPKDTPYTDDATGMVFPAKIGKFTKTGVTKNLNPYYGTAIRYANDYGSSADVYIYALDMKGEKLTAGRALAHYGAVRKNIEQLTGKSVPLGDITVLAESDLRIFPPAGKGQPESVLTGRRCSFSFSLGEDPFFSELLIFPSGTRIVKVRITY